MVERSRPTPRALSMAEAAKELIVACQDHSHSSLREVQRALLTLGDAGLTAADGAQALWSACHIGFVEAAAALLDHGVDVDGIGASMQPALLWASSRGYPLVRCLC